MKGTDQEIAQALTLAGECIDFDNDRRPRYRIPNTKTGVPGVTTVLGQTVAKGGLTWWAAKCAVDSVRENLNFKNPAALEDVLDAAYRSHDKVKRSKGTIGTIAHDCIHAWAVGDPWDTYMPADPESNAATRAALAFLSDRIETIIAAEVTVVSDRLEWAGTCDLVGRASGGLLTVVDWKTGKSLYREQMWQAAAYATGVNVALQWAGIDERVRQTIVVHCCRETGLYTHVTTLDWAEDAASFQRCVANYRQLSNVEKRIAAAVKDAAKAREVAA